MTREEFIKLLEERGDVVYIVDRGLVRFGKFSVALVAMFALVGVFFFGIDIKKALDETKEARFETEKTHLELIAAKEQTLLQLSEAKKQLTLAEEQLNQSKSSVAASASNVRAEMEKRLSEIVEMNKRALGIEQEIISVRLRLPQVEDAKALVPVGASTNDNSGQVASADLTIHVALVSDIDKLLMADLSRVASALQKQVVRDLKPIWGVEATVEAFRTLESVPIGYWPLIVQRDIQFAGALGTHQTKNGTPFGLVTYASDLDEWTLTASHELLNMLVDPQANRMFSGASPRPEDKGKVVDFLVEISDPSEASDFGYRVDGLLVSDFVTPDYFASTDKKPTRYSFTNAVKEARSVLNGGYVTWRDKQTSEWFQAIWFTGDKPRIRSLGKF